MSFFWIQFCFLFHKILIRAGLFKAGLVRNLISDMKVEKEIQFYSLCLQFDAVKREEKIIRENAFEQKKKKPALTFNSSKVRANRPSNNWAQNYNYT